MTLLSRKWRSNDDLGIVFSLKMDFAAGTDTDLLKVKETLNQNKIKLWLSPYFSEKDGINEDEIKNLASIYSSELSISLNKCLECLHLLQKTALDNLKERNNYQSTGVATLKVRVPGDQGSGRIITVSTELSKAGVALKELISKEISTPVERLRIIFRGKILKDEEILEEQGVKHGSHVMAIILRSTSDLAKEENNSKYLDSMKADLKLLADDKYEEDYLQVADQSGKLLTLPEKERKALILAMALHEKGRAAIKREDFALALVLLLEAEKEFSFCNSDLLKSVDNYGLLNLDIVWCYLNLQSVMQLPDAEQRLSQCQLTFHQSYGPNLERLIALKGSASNESALFVRLHLLQAIVLYHQNKITEAQELLQKVEEELKSLEVDDSQLSQLIELGYSAADSMLALRQAKGDLNMAVNIIENKSMERKKNEESARKAKELKKEKKKLGKCINGDWMDPQAHKTLISMGYSYEAARWALAQTSNDVAAAVELIQEHPDLVPQENEDVKDEAVEYVTGLGFKSKMAKLALKRHKGNVEEAVHELVVKGGLIEESSDSSPSCSSSDDSLQQHQEAYSRVSEGMADSEEDHLDLNLVAEKGFLEKYKELIAKR